MIRYDQDSPEFERQTAVMDSLPHAVHPMHEDWRTMADALIEGLAARGYVLVRVKKSA